MPRFRNQLIRRDRRGLGPDADPEAAEAIQSPEAIRKILDSLGLPEQGHNTENDNFNFQVKETAVLSSRFNHEVQFRVGGLARVFEPVNSGVHIVASDAFRGGGAILNGESKIRNYEFSNLPMYNIGSHTSLPLCCCVPRTDPG